MKIHLWTPGIDPNSGGIETYSYFLLKSLPDIASVGSIAVFAKNDRAGRADATPRIRYTGRIPVRLRTAAFSALAATSAFRDRPDLIISTHLNFSPLARWLKARAGIPYWVSLHGIEAWNLTRSDRRQGLADADVLLPVSSYTRDIVSREQSLPLDRFRLLPNAFDPEAFHIGSKPDHLLKRYGISPEQPVILTVGRLSTAERYKGQDRVLRVLKEVAEQMRNAECGTRNERLSDLQFESPAVASHPLRPSSDLPAPCYLIVGDGDDRPRLENLATELGVRESVIFAGKVPAEELNDHYNLCDLFAMPSTGEGFGIVFLEALACGKPVLAGNKDASRDALFDGELGVLVDPEDPAQIAEAICRILERRSQRTEVRGQQSAFHLLAPSSQLPAPRSPLSAPRSQLPAPSSQLPAPSSQLCAPSSQLPASSSSLQIPEIVFQPEALRQKVIESFGYEKFKQTLGSYLGEFFPETR